jgi:hypothetical protein
VRVVRVGALEAVVPLTCGKVEAERAEATEARGRLREKGKHGRVVYHETAAAGSECEVVWLLMKLSLVVHAQLVEVLAVAVSSSSVLRWLQNHSPGRHGQNS